MTLSAPIVNENSDKSYAQAIVVDGLTLGVFPKKEALAELRDAGITCLTNTCSTWEGPLDTIRLMRRWDLFLEENADLAVKVTSVEDIANAKSTNRLGVIYGFQNSSPLNGELDLVEVFHRLGGRMMQLTYNNQSLAAGGCYEPTDAGLSRFGHELVREMNRIGLMIDLSHTGDRSCIETIEASKRPVAITHANPKWFNNVKRNKSDDVLRALSARGGVLGVSTFPMLMPGGSPETVGTSITLREYCEMILRLIEQMGIDHVALGTDQGGGHTVETLQYARMGTWTRKSQPRSDTKRPDWLLGGSAAQVPRIYQGLVDVGLSGSDLEKVMGGNWLRLYRDGFTPQG
jgi:microsomal dipeptidase-like Zn-dependent dipeptidase